MIPVSISALTFKVSVSPKTAVDARSSKISAANELERYDQQLSKKQGVSSLFATLCHVFLSLATAQKNFDSQELTLREPLLFLMQRFKSSWLICSCPFSRSWHSARIIDPELSMFWQVSANLDAPETAMANSASRASLLRTNCMMAIRKSRIEVIKIDLGYCY